MTKKFKLENFSEELRDFVIDAIAKDDTDYENYYDYFYTIEPLNKDTNLCAEVSGNDYDNWVIYREVESFEVNDFCEDSCIEYWFEKLDDLKYIKVTIGWTDSGAGFKEQMWRVY